MKPSRALLMFGVLSLVMAAAASAQQAPSRMPDNNAKSVCVDTHLTLSFNAPPTLGTAGQIRIYDAADNKLVDTLDVSIPGIQQNYTIGGSLLHAYTVIVKDNTATIYPHNNSLAYNKTYYVQMDSGVLTVGGAAFPGFAGDKSWVFSTKAAAPAAGTDRVVVAADGTGDFATVQGAIDFVPENNAKRLTIFIRKGIYTEIVCFTGKNNITFQGEDRAQTVIQYLNNNNFQPSATTGNSGASYRRGVFMGLNSSGVILTNFMVHNLTDYRGSQAEAVLFKEVRGQTDTVKSQTIITHMNLVSHVDTLQDTGPCYVSDTYIEGDGDFMWGSGPCFFRDCDFKSVNSGVFIVARNTEANHGFVYLNCKFALGPNGPGTRLGNNQGYAFSEMVLINCAIAPEITPVGWMGTGPTVHFWEYNSTNLATGGPADFSQRNPVSKRLTKEADAETIAKYSDPTFVLGGWTPALAPIILTQPVAATATTGQAAKLSVAAAGIPKGTYQWQFNGTPVKDGNGISGATSDTLTFANASAGNEGTYSVTVTNANGAATSSTATLTVR